MMSIRSRIFGNRSLEESGFTTAELLGNAALGVAALVVVWAAMGDIGDQVMDFISSKISNP